MKTLLTSVALVLAATSFVSADPSKGEVKTLVVPAGMILAQMSPDPMVHPFFAMCKGNSKDVSRVILANGDKVYTFTCR